VGECPGHFGHIELSRPVVHVSFAKLIKKFLKAICRRCARLKLKTESWPKYKEKMEGHFEKYGSLDQEIADDVLKEAGKATTCPQCEARNCR
jgi:DNA-directed RNA polymerase subunit A'